MKAGDSEDHSNRELQNDSDLVITELFLKSSNKSSSMARRRK